MKLFLDVDGVVNAPELHMVDIRNHAQFADVEFMNNNRSFVREEELRWQKHTALNLQKIQSAGVEIFWLTGWKHAAQLTWDNILGITSSGWLPWSWEGSPTEVEKFFALQAHLLAEPDDFIWVDDIATMNMDIQVKPFDTLNFLTVKPDPDFGLSQENFETMFNFLNI